MAKKYIDADKLRAEIEERKKVEGWCEVGKDTADVYYARGFRFACDFALTGIDSLQQEQPEVDLVAEIEKAGKDVLRQAHYHNKIFDIPQTMFDDVQLMDIFKSGVYKGYELGRRCAL